MAGRTVKCPRCKAPLQLPAESTPFFRQAKFLAIAAALTLLPVVAIVALQMMNSVSPDKVAKPGRTPTAPDRVPATRDNSSFDSEPNDAESSRTPSAWEDDIVVWTFAISPDGQTIAAYVLERSAPDYRNSVKLWDASTGKLVRDFEHSQRVNRLRFSADGSLVAGAGMGFDENQLGFTENRIWQTATGKLLTTFPGSHNHDVALSQNNRTVFSLQNQAITATSIETGETTEFRMKNEVEAEIIAFDPFGRIGVAAGLTPQPLLQLFDLQSTEEKGGVLALEYRADHVAIDPSAQWLATIGSEIDDETRQHLIVWKLAGTRQIEKVVEHELQRGMLVFGIAIARDAEYVAYEVYHEQQSRQPYVGVWSRQRNEVSKIPGQAIGYRFAPAGELVISFDRSSLVDRDRKHFEFYNPEDCRRVDRLETITSSLD